MAAILQVGFAREKITPPVGTKLFGYPNFRKSETVNDDLYVNAICFRYDGEAVLLLSLDVEGITRKQADLYREKISEETGVRPENVILTAIHTHSAPAVRTSYGWGDANEVYIREIFEPVIFRTASLACKETIAAEMSVGVTQSNVSVNRREIHGDVAFLGQNPDGVYNPAMHMISFRGITGQPIVNLVHYGCHPTSCGPGPEITRDWPGVMTDYIEEKTGIPTVFFNGAEGDIGPRLSNGRTIGNIALTKEIGKLAGEDAMRAFSKLEACPVPKLETYTEEIRLPYMPLPEKEDVECTLKEMGTPVNGVDFQLENRLRAILDIYAKGLTQENEWTFLQTVVRIGPVVLVPYPFEMFCGVELKQQEGSPFPYLLCLSQANGSECYLPTVADLPFGGYEIDSFRRQMVFALTDDAAERIVSENQRLLKTLKNNKIGSILESEEIS